MHARSAKTRGEGYFSAKPYSDTKKELDALYRAAIEVHALKSAA